MEIDIWERSDLLVTEEALSDINSITRYIHLKSTNTPLKVFKETTV